MRPAIRQILFGDTPFSPRQLFANGEQGFWYDPGDFSTMFQDSAGTTPVTAIEQPVGLILDKSGRGNHATQSPTTARPTLKQDETGRYYLSFDGADDWMQTASINFSATDNISVFAGIRKLADQVQGCVVSNTNLVGTSNGQAMLIASLGTTELFFRSRGTGNATITIDDANYLAPKTLVLSGLADISSDFCILRANGAQIRNSTADQGGVAYANAAWGIGARNDGDGKVNGRIYSLIVRGALTSGTQLTNTEAWVNTKTGAY